MNDRAVTWLSCNAVAMMCLSAHGEIMHSGSEQVPPTSAYVYVQVTHGSV